MPSSMSSYQSVTPEESILAENEPNEDEWIPSEASHLEVDTDSTQHPGVTTSIHTPAVSALHSLTECQAMIHLVKGNLGPGCLNLPHAFARTGWGLSMGLFGLVATQGIYSMCLLVYCKDALQGPQTFMDVAQTALGTGGSRTVEMLLVTLQGGVCCVFLSLVSTNLIAMFDTLSDMAAIVIVTCFLLVIVLLRFIKDLTWLSATANGFMMTAIVTATLAGLAEFMYGSDGRQLITSVANSSPANVIDFISDMFFAFEGIGLVLPIENSYNVIHRDRAASFVTVLIRSMSLVAFLFVGVGVAASLGFPDIESGSITAYLGETYPSSVWFSLVNTLVMVAVLFTFPLQLNPAMEVIDRWLDHGCSSQQPATALPTNDDDESTFRSEHVIDESTICQEQILVCQHTSVLDTKCCCIKRWIWRRWAFVFGCALVVVYVNKLSVLIALFGAIGQTGLAAMPCAIHLALQQQGIVPKSILRTALDMFILVFCAVVMVSGVVAYIVG